MHTSPDLIDFCSPSREGCPPGRGARAMLTAMRPRLVECCRRPSAIIKVVRSPSRRTRNRRRGPAAGLVSSIVVLVDKNHSTACRTASSWLSAENSFVSKGTSSLPCMRHHLATYSGMKYLPFFCHAITGFGPQAMAPAGARGSGVTVLRWPQCPLCRAAVKATMATTGSQERDRPTRATPSCDP